MDRHSRSPDPHLGFPPQNTSTPARNCRSDGGSGSDGSLRDDEESLEHSEDDLDEFLNNCEGLSDQTFGEVRRYDCSSTEVEKLSNPSTQHTLHDVSSSHLNHFHDLSCSMLCGVPDKSLAYCNEIVSDNGTISDSSRKEARIILALRSELVQANKENETLSFKYKTLCNEVKQYQDFFSASSGTILNLIPKVRSINETMEIANLSACSLNIKRDSPDTTADSLRIQSNIEEQTENDENENRSSTPIPQCLINQSSLNGQGLNELYYSFQVFKTSWKQLANSTKDDLNQRSKEMKNIESYVQLIIRNYEKELSSSKSQRVNDQKHYQEVINTLKDDIKTMKMRNQDMMKHKEQEIRELKSRVPEVNDDDDVENVVDRSPPGNRSDVHSVFDESFGSCASNLEETFTNLTRTKVEYLKLTPSEYVDDEVVDTISIPDGIRHILEDKDLKFRDLEKKFEANKRYMDELTHDRELEREEFQQLCSEHQIQIEELRRDNAKFMEEKKQLIYQIEDLTTRLQQSEVNGMEIVQKLEKSDGELKLAVEKIFELREIVREQEVRIDEMTQCVAQLEEEKQLLRDEIEKLELISKKEQPAIKEQDTYGTLSLDVTDEIHHQLQDLARRIEFKVGEMDSIQIHTRPGSSCSGITSAVSTEDISCREARMTHNFENLTLEHLGSAIFNEIHRLESQFENLVRYDDVFVKKLKDAELQNMGQKTKIEDQENQIQIYQDKCGKQALKIADLEGKIDAMRFETTNPAVVTALQTRLTAATKQLEELRDVLFRKEKELEETRQLLSRKDKDLSQAFSEYTQLKAEHKRIVDKLDASTQTKSVFEETVSYRDSTFEGASPEKIRRMDTANPLNASVISIAKTFMKEGNTSGGPEVSFGDSLTEKGRSERSSVLAGGDTSNSSAAGEITIKELDDSIQELHNLINEKDQKIKELTEQLQESGKAQECAKCKQVASMPDMLVDSDSERCEEESVTIDTEIGELHKQVTSNTGKPNRAKNQSMASGDSSSYEISFSHDYEVEGDLLKYLGTKLLHQGYHKESYANQGEKRMLETDKQIEIETLNTQILQLERALEEEKKKSQDLFKRLKVCETEKAALRSHNPRVTGGPVRNVVSTSSHHQMQQKELARQIEIGRQSLLEKDKEIRSLKNKIGEVESKLKGKENHEKELMTRLNSTIAMLRRCEDHGRDLTSSNQEQIHEIRRLKTQLERASVNRGTENSSQSQCVTSSGIEYFENYMRAKSHRKALAWQKKYLSSVIMGYKSILRLNGHGTEHPDLLQTHVPIAPSAVGYLNIAHPKTRFRVAVLAVVATMRMKFMVSRWGKKRPGETSPDSEYKISRNPSRAESSSVRQKRTVLAHSRVNSSHAPVDNNALAQEARHANLGDITEYFSRFTSLENEIAGSLSRNIRPSK